MSAPSNDLDDPDELRESPSEIKLFGRVIHQKSPDPPESKSEAEAETESRVPTRNLPCPRCRSKETKFCYFNNYNVNQPRHFCRSCRRYWTAGGALRNVPVGSGSRGRGHSRPGPYDRWENNQREQSDLNQGVSKEN